MVGVVGQERAPGLARWARGSAPSVALDRTLRDHQPELEQFAADPFAAPARVVPRHRRDQLAHLGTEPWPAQWSTGAPAPEEAPGLPLPADDALRLDQDKVSTPVGAAQSADHNPEEFVAGAE